MERRQINTLAQRLDHLERLNRWWRIVGITAFAVLGLILLVSAKGYQFNDEISARRFNIVDNDGKLRGSFQLRDNGDVELALNHKDGKVRSRMWVRSSYGSSGLSLYDENEKARAELIMTAKVMPSLSFMDENGKLLATMGLLPAVSGLVPSQPRLVFKKPDGRDIWSAP